MVCEDNNVLVWGGLLQGQRACLALYCFHSSPEVRALLCLLRSGCWENCLLSLFSLLISICLYELGYFLTLEYLNTVT